MPRVCFDRDDNIESGIVDFGFKHKNLCVWLAPPEFGVEPPEKRVLQIQPLLDESALGRLRRSLSLALELLDQ
jgi:hypothetical protein